MSYIGLEELRNLNVHQLMSDYYLLERLVADGSRTARDAQRKLEAYAAPRLMRYLSAICGGEMRHALGGEGCEGSECNGYSSENCECCGYDEDENHQPGICNYCGEDQDDPQHDECECEGECSCNFDHEYDEQWYCDCYCPSEMCYACELAEAGDLRVDIDGDLADWVRLHSGGSEASRGDAWAEWLEYHDANGSRALRDLWLGFEADGWASGYGGEAWALIARYAYEYQAGKISAHAFMDRCWTLHHNGGNVFDKMFDSYSLDRQLMHQANDNYEYLTRSASPQVRDLWIIRRYVLSDSLGRSPEWLGRELPVGVEW